MISRRQLAVVRSPKAKIGLEVPEARQGEDAAYDRIVLADHLREAEIDGSTLAPALTALDALEHVDRRHILASYAALN